MNSTKNRGDAATDASDATSPTPPAPGKDAVAVTRGAAAREWLGQTLRQQGRSWDRAANYLGTQVTLKPGAARTVLRRMQSAAQSTFATARKASNATTESVTSFPSTQVDNALRKMLARTPTTPMAQTAQHLAVLSWMYAEGYNAPGVEPRVAMEMRDDLRRAILLALASSSPREAIARVMAEHIPELQ